MIFIAYPEEQRDLQWVTVTLTVISTLLLTWRISSTITSRGWLGLEDAFVIMANVSLCSRFKHRGTDTLQVWLILLAAFIYKSTTYGFGMHVSDIQRTGGSVTEALKVRTLFYPISARRTKISVAVLLADTVPIYTHQRFQQDGLLGVVLPLVSHEALPTSMLDTGGHICRLDHLLRLRMHFPMHPGTSRIQQEVERDMHQLHLASVCRTIAETFAS